MGTYLVFGAAGHIGREIVRQLIENDQDVIASVRKNHREAGNQLREMGATVVTVDNVADGEDVKKCATFLSEGGFEIDGIVYAVGHCPSGGFADAVKYSPLTMSDDRFMREIEMHQQGPFNIFRYMWPILKNGGSFVFLSSAITRHKGNFPSWLHAHHHAGAISAGDWLIDGVRHDAETASRNIKIHRIAPGAVDTPFHEGGEHPSPQMVSVYEVTEEVLVALQSSEHVDKEIL